MLEFKMECEKQWVEFRASDFQSTPLLVGYKLRINGKVFKSSTKEFWEAFNKELVWEKLKK